MLATLAGMVLLSFQALSGLPSKSCNLTPLLLPCQLEQGGQRCEWGLLHMSALFFTPGNGGCLIVAAIPLHHLSIPVTGLSLNVYLPFRLKCASAPLTLSGLPSEGCNLNLHCYPISWGPKPALDCVCDSHFCPSPVLPPLLIPIHPPSHVSMH